jgi:hypothetical protein
MPYKRFYTEIVTNMTFLCGKDSLVASYPESK